MQSEHCDLTVYSESLDSVTWQYSDSLDINVVTLTVTILTLWPDSLDIVTWQCSDSLDIVTWQCSDSLDIVTWQYSMWQVLTLSL